MHPTPYTLASLLFLLLFSLKSYALSVYFPFTEQGFGDDEVDTLEELDNWLQQNYVSGSVTIFIAPGTYTGSTSWNFDAGDDLLKISAQDVKNRPVFDACLQNPCEQGQLNGFFLRVEPTVSTYRLKNITIQYLEIKNYVNGIYFDNIDNSAIRKTNFSNLGSAFNKNIPLIDGKRQFNGYSAITTNNSTGLTIEYNNIENAYNDDRPLWMHAIYLKKTSNTTVYNNTINMVSGDPIRMRNQSENILIERNHISNSGQVAISTFEKAGEECPSIDITAKRNYYGMMFPYNSTYSEDGFDSGWANKNYLKEGLIQNQGYKVTVDPAESPTNCPNHNVRNKWAIFTNEGNHFVIPTTDPRILNSSENLELRNTGDDVFIRMSQGSKIIIDTHFFFVACNSYDKDTCSTTSTEGDIDDFNSDDSTQEYYLKMTVKSGTVPKKLHFDQAVGDNKYIEIPANPGGDWFTFSVPFHLNVAQRSEALLTWTALNNGLFVKEIRLSEIK